MKDPVAFAILILSLAFPSMGGIYEDVNTEIRSYGAKTIDGKNSNFGQYQGKVVLIVNVASQCGYTRQYAGLESLYRKYKDRGFVVLGFPCDQFGGQEPGTEKEIKAFCESKYGVTFPLFSKIEVNGRGTHSLYRMLKKDGGDIWWNFTKFLVGRDGRPLQRFEPKVEPKDLEKDIEKALALSPGARKTP
jgi:glutathione peroxidase